MYHAAAALVTAGMPRLRGYFIFVADARMRIIAAHSQKRCVPQVGVGERRSRHSSQEMPLYQIGHTRRYRRLMIYFNFQIFQLRATADFLCTIFAVARKRVFWPQALLSCQDEDKTMPPFLDASCSRGAPCSPSPERRNGARASRSAPREIAACRRGMVKIPCP